MMEGYEILYGVRESVWFAPLPALDTPLWAASAGYHVLHTCESTSNVPSLFL